MDLALAGLSFLVAVRLLRARSPEEDQRAYHKWEHWYALVLVAAITVLLQGSGSGSGQSGWSGRLTINAVWPGRLMTWTVPW